MKSSKKGHLSKNAKKSARVQDDRPRPSPAKASSLLCATNGDRADLMQTANLEQLASIALREGADRRARISAISQLARIASRCVRTLQMTLHAHDEIVKGEGAAGIAGIRIGVATIESEINRVARLPSGLAVLLAHAANQPIQLPQFVEYAQLEKSQALSLSAPSPEDLDAASKVLESNNLPLYFCPKSACKIECAGAMSLFLPTAADIYRDIAERSISKNSIAGVVIQRRTLPYQCWSIPFYIVTQTFDHKAKISILGVSSIGKLVWAGELEVTKNSAPFVLRPIKQPGTFPLQIEGVVKDGIIRIDIVRVSSRRLPSVPPKPRLKRTVTDQTAIRMEIRNAT